MGGIDKAALRLGERNLLEIAVSNLAHSLDIIALCIGRVHVANSILPQINDYEVDGATIGPAGALLAALDWAESESLAGIITLPVDTPIMPEDCCEQLVATGGSTYSRHKQRDHWLHAAWPIETVPMVRSTVLKDKTYALHRIHNAIGSQSVEFGEAASGAFHNINTPDDLTEAELFLNL